MTFAHMTAETDKALRQFSFILYANFEQDV